MSTASHTLLKLSWHSCHWIHTISCSALLEKYNGRLRKFLDGLWCPLDCNACPGNNPSCLRGIRSSCLFSVFDKPHIRIFWERKLGRVGKYLVQYISRLLLSCYSRRRDRHCRLLIFMASNSCRLNRIYFGDV